MINHISNYFKFPDISYRNEIAGTYLALRSLISQSKLEDEVDVMKTVFKLRSQRPKLVQTFEQYVLLYQVSNTIL